MPLQGARLTIRLTAKLTLVKSHVEVLPDVHDNARALLRREAAPIHAAVVRALRAVRLAGRDKMEGVGR